MADTFSTTVIPTVGRATLARAVRSVLDQRFDEAPIELVVVNDSGQPLPVASWQDDPRVRVLHTDRRERCIARNTGAAVAGGRFLHFLDDDDVLLPGGMLALWKRAVALPDAAWVYGSWEVVDNDGRVLGEFHPRLNGNILAPLVAGEGVPLQASLVRRTDFETAGGFDPVLCGVEDRDLGRRLALAGEAAWTPVVVSRIRMGRVGSTTDWSRLPEHDRLGREKVLAVDATFDRLRASATSDYFRGRVVRAYVASAVWNLKRRRVGVALDRIGSSLALAVPRLVRPGLWTGLWTRNP
jgi:glycosyltransferase involved in cell wall biosynthesis